jgi:HAD superfamily hydrolase (TIGR01509 family)
MTYDNIIFDFDGTITDSREDIAGAQLWVLGELGVRNVIKEQLFPHIGKTLQETFSIILPTELHLRIPEAIRLYSEYYPPRSLITTVLFPGVRETLSELHGRGKRLAVASTKRGTGILRATEHFGITPLFRQLQGSDNIPYKPDPAILNKILADQGWSKDGTLMVGDTLHDIEAGRNAGIATCGVTYGALSEEEMVQSRPDYVIRRMDELLAIVDGYSLEERHFRKVDGKPCS